MDAFQQLFGDVTVGQIVLYLTAFGFLYAMFCKVRKYFTDKALQDSQRDKDIKEAISAARSLPGYREQSLQIQKKLNDDISALRKGQEENNQRLTKMEEDMNRRKRNELKDKLLQSYRYYANPEHNPSQSWTVMEADAFWALFKDYEDIGGNGFVHSVIQPAMNKLTIVQIDE